MDYVPTTWPGARLPHAWLDDSTALQDRLGDGYTLLCLGGTRTETAPLERAFAALKAPFSAMTVSDPRHAYTYRVALTLGRLWSRETAATTF